ncbi:MAG: hypothetical protein MI725_07645 [Pirellulales bacterium]|nr:hypothetical protein [Pirellulales bacterium]
MSSSEQDGLLLPGLDGTNPLGFLAALGLLRVLSRRLLLRMSWQPQGSYYCPQVFFDNASADSLLEELMSALNAQDQTPWLLDRKLPFKYQAFEEACKQAIEGCNASDRYVVDVLAGLGAMPRDDKRDVFSDTDLRMVRSGDSAGNGLLAYAVRIRKETTEKDLEDAFFSPWVCTDKECALRWDPLENRTYALRWTNPSKEATLSVRGANRMALEALACLPVIPTGQDVQTAGFTTVGRARKAFTWCLWEQPATFDAVCPLLRTDLVNESAISLRRRGVLSVLRCHRIMTSQYYANFTPAQRIA